LKPLANAGVVEDVGEVAGHLDDLAVHAEALEADGALASDAQVLVLTEERDSGGNGGQVRAAVVEELLHFVLVALADLVVVLNAQLVDGASARSPLAQLPVPPQDWPHDSAQEPRLYLARQTDQQNQRENEN